MNTVKTTLNVVKSSILICLFVTVAVVPLTLQANSGNEESARLSRWVVDSQGNEVTNLPPLTSYTVYLNDDQSRILTDNGPRWDDGDPNIPGDGRYITQLGNFAGLSEGDSAYVRFSDSELGERGVDVVEIDELPWQDPTPWFDLQLEPVDFPARPTGLELESGDGANTLNWDDPGGDLTWRVYRTYLEDIAPSGDTRHVYSLIAEGVAEAGYVDDDLQEGRTYAYLVYGENGEGELSPRSEEVQERLFIEGLAADPQATNVHLTWQAFDTPVGETGGYNIYRRTAEGEYGDPVGYTGAAPIYPEPRYTDDRLEPGRTYFYKVKARNKQLDEYGESDEVEVTTESSTEGYYTYANLDVAVVIYKNAIDSDGREYQMTDKQVEDIIELLEVGREFVWRNTNMKLNMNHVYYVIEDLKDFEGISRANSVQPTGRHLTEDYGVINTQYDIVYRVTGATAGNWSRLATHSLELPGPERQTAFSQHNWPAQSPTPNIQAYPGYFPDNEEPNNHVWLYTHEMQHAVDGLYRANGHYHKGHGDRPERYGQNPDDYPQAVDLRYGRRFDFQAALYRGFDPAFEVYEDLKPEWGRILETVDADGDGFPDDDPRVPLDEARFGSSPEHKDTSGDGLDDKASATDGIFHYSYADPNTTDTSGDGVADGETDYPRYRNLNTNIKDVDEGEPFTPVVDGDVSEWPEDRTVSDSTSWASHGQSYAPRIYMSYDEEQMLYLAMDLPDMGVPELRFDFDAGGYWFGRGNTMMDLHVTENRFLSLVSWDGTPEARQWAVENTNRDDGAFDDELAYQREFGRVFYEDELDLEIQRTGSRIQIELAIPRKQKAGLYLQPGDEIGLQINYHNVNGNSGAYATTFDQWSYVYFTLGEHLVGADQEQEVVQHYRLEPNYPNPFNPATNIEFAIPESGHVDLIIYDVLGREVARPVSGELQAGTHTVSFDGGGLASGTYIYRLKTADYRRERTMMFVK